MALSRLVTISISSLRNVDIEPNKFYDIAHRLYDMQISFKLIGTVKLLFKLVSVLLATRPLEVILNT